MIIQIPITIPESILEYIQSMHLSSEEKEILFQSFFSDLLNKSEDSMYDFFTDWLLNKLTK
jgi:hypothetical protein